MIVEVRATGPAGGLATWPGGRARCALGRAGVARVKREGDGATPAGTFAFRRALFRPDRWPAPPATSLPIAALAPGDGWCDDPADPAYNRAIRLPHRARHERMWRADALYDLVLVIGHNDDPPVAGAGSAIFVHVARPDFGPTEGCVALARADLAALAAALAPGDSITIEG